MVAMFVAFLFMRSTAGIFWSAENRFFFHWQRSDTWAVFLAIGFCALVFLAGYRVVARMGNPGRWMADIVFIGIVVFYAKVNLAESVFGPRTVPAALNWGVKVLMGLIVATALFRRQEIKRIAVAGCLILSPILLVYAWTLAAAHPIRTRIVGTPSPGGKAGARIPRMRIVVFDMWAYSHTFSNMAVVGGLPNFAKLANMSVAFHHAESPGTRTLSSIPQMICGAQGEVVIKGDSVMLETEQRSLRLDDTDHLFKRMGRRGYRIRSLGNYLPYAELFPSGVSCSDSYDFFAFRNGGVVGVAGGLVWENVNIRLAALPGASERLRNYRDVLFAMATEAIRQKANQSVRDNESLLFVHYPVPHMPFCFDITGRVARVADRGIWSQDIYAGNLRYADQLLGGLMASDAWEDELWVVTSDHGLRVEDSDELNAWVDASEVRHVPLLIHLPGQETRVPVDGQFRLVGLNALLERYLDSDGTTDSFVRSCQEAIQKQMETRHDTYDSRVH